MDTIRVLIADDHPMVRQGIRTFLERQPDVDVVGEAANGQEAVRRAGELAPDVVLMDLRMPVLDGIAATREIKTRQPAVAIVVLTSFADDAQITDALQAGASGYLLKEISPTNLIDGIRAAARGDAPLAPQVAKRLVENTRQPRPRADAEIELLSERELQVLKLLGQGLSNKEIAGQLVISDKTVKFHVSSILSKLHLSDRTQAALFAAKHGLISPD